MATHCRQTETLKSEEAPLQNTVHLLAISTSSTFHKIMSLDISMFTILGTGVEIFFRMKFIPINVKTFQITIFRLQIQGVMTLYKNI